MAVYFLQEDEPGRDRVKIGYTNDMQQRLGSLGFLSPSKLKLLSLIPNGSLDLEKRLHAKFANYRLHGEWFFPDRAIIDYAEKMNGKHIPDSVEEVVAWVSSKTQAESITVLSDLVYPVIYAETNEWQLEQELASGVSYVVIGLGKLPTNFEPGINFVELKNERQAQ